MNKMDQVYIKTENLNEWIAKYFPHKDLISVDDLLAVIEDLDGELSDLRTEYEEYQQNVAENYEQILYQKQVE